MPRIQQPNSQIKLTNVSLVRLRKGGKRFEIACYKNKVLEWRSGLEKDLDNVLQIPSVFLNVTKGQTAPREDLHKAFGDKSQDDIVLEILNKGELQVGEQERREELDRIRNEVVGMVAAKLVDPRTQRVYTTGIIEKALDMISSAPSHPAPAAGSAGGPAAADDKTTAHQQQQPQHQKDHVWRGVVTNKSAKIQALDAMRALVARQPIPLQRARMRLRIVIPSAVAKRHPRSTSTTTGGKPHGSAQHTDGAADADHHHATVKDVVLSHVEQVDSQSNTGSDWEVVGFAEPGALKTISDLVTSETAKVKGAGTARVEVLDMAVIDE